MSEVDNKPNRPPGLYESWSRVWCSVDLELKHYPAFQHGLCGRHASVELTCGVLTEYLLLPIWGCGELSLVLPQLLCPRSSQYVCEVPVYQQQLC